ncbi:MAG: hypothetical protein AAGD38_17190 [Acidobacteriota bacterium]
MANDKPDKFSVSSRAEPAPAGLFPGEEHLQRITALIEQVVEDLPDRDRDIVIELYGLDLAKRDSSKDQISRKAAYRARRRFGDLFKKIIADATESALIHSELARALLGYLAANPPESFVEDMDEASRMRSEEDAADRALTERFQREDIRWALGLPGKTH